MSPTLSTAPTSDTVRAPDALDGTGLDIFAPLYLAASRCGVGPGEVDDLEVWQLAAVLGVDMTDTATSGPGKDGPPAPGALSRGRRALRKLRGRR